MRTKANYINLLLCDEGVNTPNLSTNKKKLLKNAKEQVTLNTPNEPLPAEGLAQNGSVDKCKVCGADIRSFASVGLAMAHNVVASLCS